MRSSEVKRGRLKLYAALDPLEQSFAVWSKIRYPQPRPIHDSGSWFHPMQICTVDADFFSPLMLQRERMPHNDIFRTCMKTVRCNRFYKCKKIQRESNNFFSINIWCIERHELNTWQNLKWKWHCIWLNVVDAAEMCPLKLNGSFLVRHNWSYCNKSVVAAAIIVVICPEGIWIESSRMVFFMQQYFASWYELLSLWQ